MWNNKIILLINQEQFGYKAGYYHYCKHLCAIGYKIIFLCNDQNLRRLELDGVQVIYNSSLNSCLNSCLKWRKQLIAQLNDIYRYNHIYVSICSYFRGCCILKLLHPHKHIILDIRSGDLSQNINKRLIFNKLIKFESSFFGKTMILSESLAQLLKLRKLTYSIVPLGADIIYNGDKDYSTMNLLYVGTLRQREIHKTVLAIGLFRQSYPHANIHYDIVGFGSQEEENQIINLISENQLNDIVFFRGRVAYDLLLPYFESANIGVAFVPITSYYDCQPSTKIYEYILSGLFCIATQTKENANDITSSNGLLCNDSVESFFEALVQYYEMDKNVLTADTIRSTMLDHLWKNIVCHKLTELFLTCK